MALTAKEVVKKMQADQCYTMSRSRSKKKHNNYSIKYTQCLGERGYTGIRKDGYFTKFYSYGVVGHCCIGVQAWFIWSGLEAFVPKNVKYIWNTNVYRKWLKTEPTIKGFGKVEWTMDPKKAKLGAVVFTGKVNSKGASHTSCFLKYENEYVYTVNFNISGKKNGKKINNGVIKKYKKNRIKGIANMPYPSGPYIVGRTYVLQANMNLRRTHSTKDAKLGVLKKGSKITIKQVVKEKDGSYWVRINEKHWICARNSKNKKYIK